MKLKLSNKKKIKKSNFLIAVLLVSGIFAAFHRPIIQQSADAYSEIRRFLDVFNAVRDYYIENVKSKSLVDGAIVGLLKKLDSHSIYIPSDQVDFVNDKFEGSYFGVGVEFVIQNNYPVIISPMPDSPAERIRLRPGDILLKIDNISTFGLTDSEIIALLKGEVGSLVRITIQRPNFKEQLIYNVIRNRISIRSIRCSFMIDEEIGYLNLGRFARTTSDEVLKALQNLEMQGMKKLIFDLRNNSGGFLDQAVAVADFFLPGGRTIVYTKGRIPSSNEKYYSTSNLPLREYPIVIIINKGTASSAEVFASALQDWDRAAIVGETSFGKGFIQNQISLKDGSEVRISIAQYFTPYGRPIQRPINNENQIEKVYSTYSGRKVYGGKGIQPDIKKILPPLSTTAVKLESKMLYYEFASQLAPQIKEKYRSINSYKNSFMVNNSILQRFSTFLKRKNIKYDNREFKNDRSYIQQEIKSEIAGQIWEKDSYYRIHLNNDPQFQSSVSAFPLAERLVLLSLGEIRQN